MDKHVICYLSTTFLLRDTNIVYHLLDPDPSPRAETFNPPVVEGGPLVIVDKGKADKEDQEVDQC